MQRCADCQTTFFEILDLNGYFGRKFKNVKSCDYQIDGDCKKNDIAGKARGGAVIFSKNDVMSINFFIAQNLPNRVRLDGVRGLQVNLDPTCKLATPFFERKTKGLPDFNVL